MARAWTNLAAPRWVLRGRSVRSVDRITPADPPASRELNVAEQSPSGPVQNVGERPPSVVMPTTRLGRVVAAPIVAYRRWISPALPPTCRFYPSCSEYALTAIAVHGPIRGIGLAIRRLLRCHPFHPGGIDHVPLRRTTAADPSPVATDQEH